MTCYNSELPIGPPGPTGPIGPQGPQGTTLPYKVYTALLTQSGINAPTAIVLEDTIENISFSYQSVGLYKIENVSSTSNKVFVLLGTSSNSNTRLNYYGPNFIGISVTDFSNVSVDGVGGSTYLTNTPIEIRIYP